MCERGGGPQTVFFQKHLPVPFVLPLSLQFLSSPGRTVSGTLQPANATSRVHVPPT